MAMSDNIKDREHQKFFEDESGDTAVRVGLTVGSLGSLLQGVSWDYLVVTYPSSVKEDYTFKSGGPSGTTTAVIEITYTSSSKESLDNVFRSS